MGDAYKRDLDKIIDKAQDVRDLALENMEALRDAVDELSAQLKMNASNAREISSARLNDVSESIRLNPLSAVALAAGVGLIVGLLSHRDARPR